MAEVTVNRLCIDTYWEDVGRLSMRDHPFPKFPKLGAQKSPFHLWSNDIGQRMVVLRLTLSSRGWVPIWQLWTPYFSTYSFPRDAQSNYEMHLNSRQTCVGDPLISPTIC